MVAYSTFMYVQWSEATPPSPAPSPAPAPAPSSPPDLHREVTIDEDVFKTVDASKADYGRLDKFTTSHDHVSAVSDPSTTGDNEEGKDHKKCATASASQC